MRKLPRVILLVIALSTPAMSIAAGVPAAKIESPAAAVEGLLAEDRAFSAASAKTDLVSGLSAMFDDRVIMPLPNATFARSKAEAIEGLRANPANAAARAEWAPVRGGISADGQHGFTFGYMTVMEAGKPPREAKYLAYWVKRPEGWRVAAYKRAPKPEGAGTAPMEPLLPAKPVGPAADPAVLDGYRNSLSAAEKAFSDEAQKIGVGPAFRKNGHADAMNMGQGAEFRIGADNIGADMGNDPVSPVNWGADEVLVAASGDMGVTFGMIRSNGPVPEGRPASIPFFTVWHRASPDAAWRYIAE